MHSVKGAQFLNTACFIFPSAAIAASSASAPTIVIDPLTRIYASL